MTEQTQRIGVTDALRGIASLAVCWYHLTHGNAAFLPDGVLKSSGALGWLGVEVFFVISGFVIPYALWKASYQVRNFGAFLWKRIIRLDPPYLASIALVLCAAYVSEHLPGFRGVPSSYSLTQLLMHFGYLNTFFDYPWLNPVYWTLAIEFQYYLSIGLLYPLIASTGRWPVVLGMGAAVALSFAVPHEAFIFHWLGLFMMGILAFRYRVDLVGRRTFLLVFGLLACANVVTLGLVITIAGGASCILIAFVRGESRVLSFFGRISYSLYLTHVVVGGRIVNFADRYSLSMGGRTLTVFVGLAITIAFAYAFYLAIEKPSQSLSARVSYRRPAQTTSGVPEEQLASP